MPRKTGIYPSPVYEALLSSGDVVRMSFFSPAGKPIDVLAGRRAIEATSAVLDQARTKWVREGNAWYCRYERKAEIVAGTVEHVTIGKIDDSLTPIAIKRRAPNWRQLVSQIREQLVNGNSDSALAAIDNALAA